MEKSINITELTTGAKNTMNATNGVFRNAGKLSWAPPSTKCDNEKAVVALYCFVATLCTINIFACVLNRIQRQSNDLGLERV